MGGNARYINRVTGKDLGFAEKIDLNKIDRSTLVQEITETLRSINKLHTANTQTPLWKEFGIITEGVGLNGSSKFLFDSTIDNNTFKTYKPFLGDIDVTFPSNLMESLWNLLNTLEGTKLSETITYLGHKNSAIDPLKAKNLNQINAVFKLKTDLYESNIQIDFEASEYVDNKPTEWTSFSHNSEWEDIKEGLKGVMHKYMLINLSRANSVLKNIAVVTKSQESKLTSKTSKEYMEIVLGNQTKQIAKMSTNRDYINPTNLAFSVDRGVRTKFTPLQHSDGRAVILDGITIMKFVKPEDANYITDLKEVFQHIFNTMPDNQDMIDFRSFVGVIKLMKKYVDNNTIETFFIDHLINKSLFAPYAQGLERNDPDGDKKIKMTMIDKLIESFPQLDKFKDQIDTQMNNYYKSYKMYDLNESSKPQKLSAIFESINNTDNK